MDAADRINGSRTNSSESSSSFEMKEVKRETAKASTIAAKTLQNEARGKAPHSKGSRTLMIGAIIVYTTICFNLGRCVGKAEMQQINHTNDLISDIIGFTALAVYGIAITILLICQCNSAKEEAKQLR